MSLVVCSSCTRHVRAGESACPFCGGTDLASSGPPEIMPVGSNRAQIFLGALAIAAATSAAACNKSETPTHDPNQGIVQPYGAPIPIDAGAAPIPSAPDAAPPLKPPAPTGAYGAPPKP